MTIDQIIKQDKTFQNQKVAYSPLNGGFSNETYLVKANQNKYVIKINFNQNLYLKLDREKECIAQKKAAALGFAPKVVSFPKDGSYMISEYFDGHGMTYDEITDQFNMLKLIDILKGIHSIKGLNRKCSCFDLIDRYAEGIKKLRVSVPEGYYDVLKKVDIIRNRRSKDLLNNNKYVHNDILGNNILFDGQKIIIIDWELSGIGDPFMDLASLAYSNTMTKEQEEFMLTAYFGYCDKKNFDTLQDLKYIGMIREVVWAFFYEGLNKKSVNHNINYHEAGLYALNRIKNGYNTLWGNQRF
ncbi:MAG TPA: phosphotransferase [Clostridia bacterium]